MKKRLFKKVFARTFIVIAMIIACLPISNVKANGDAVASYDDAVSSIVIPRYEADGSKVDQRVSDTLKSYLDTSDLVAQRDSMAKTLTLNDLQLKDVYLDSDYLNGTAGAGRSYFNMLNFYTDVKQVKQLLTANPGYSVIDSQGNTVDEAYVDELLGLLDQINDFDPSTNLKYNYGSVFDAQEFAKNSKLGGTDVIATSKEGNVSFKFHIDSHGYWGYDLGAHDSITGIVMGYENDYAYQNQRDLTTKYANFFVIEMENKGPGKWYMLNNTDLENPMIYVSEDGKEAFMIDVDFYGENVLNRIIKEVIGKDCESLKIFLTHNHPDHVNNLAKIAEDPELKEITTIIWPENEPHTVLNGVDLVELFDNVTIKDMEKISAAGNEFQFIEIPDEHTPGGGQLADLTNKVIYSGDSLGAQVHLGGTTISMSSADNWLAGARKAEAYIKENGIKYNIGGHTPYLNDAQFASWVATAIEYAKEQFAADASWKGGLVVVENGEVVSSERLQEMFANGVSDREELSIASVNFNNNLVAGNYEQAVNEIIIPRYEADGNKVDQRVSDTLKSYLDTTNLVAVKNARAQTLTLNDLQLKDVYLDSDYLNGVSPAGRSYFNMLNFYTDVKQVKQLLRANPGYSVIDSQGNTVDEAYVDELLGLLDQINDFDPSTNLKYNYDSVFDAPEFAKNSKLGGTDVIATSKEGNVSFKFHIDSHGYWGYDLGAHDSITGIVMGYDEAYAQENQHDLTVQYANFFVIEMENKGPGKWYMLNNTDLENPMIYVSEDGKEAFMIDVDFYGENVLNRIIKEVIGKDCESLKIFLTHNHGDHVNNLAKIAEDPELKEITTIIWPENEPHTVLDDVDLVELFDNITIKDMEKFNAAGNEFQFIEIPDEHTPGGGQLADLTNKVIYSGDSLGAQVHLGGTTIGISNADNWLAGARKAEAYIKENGIKYNIGGHTPYLNDAQFASWVATAIEYAKEQFAADASWKGGLVVVENGEVVSSERLQEMFKNGLSDREELNIASVNFRNDIKPDENPDLTPDKDPDTTPNGDQVKTDDKVISGEKTNSSVKTGDQNLFTEFLLMTVLALSGGLFSYKKRYNK